jgi:hypothetical protein
LPPITRSAKTLPCRHAADQRLDLAGDALQFGEVRAGDLDADRRLDAGGEHVDAGLDRHRPGVGQAGDLHGGVQRRDQFVDGAAAVGDDLAGRSLMSTTGHSSSGFSMIVVSIMSIGAGSVAVSARPILPKT